MTPPDESPVAIVGDPVVYPNVLFRVAEFNRIGQIAPPANHFNADRVGFYTGMQLEELAEKIKAISEGCVTPNDRNAMARFSELMQQWGRSFKAGNQHGAVLRANREDMLDADIDIIVVSIGAGIYATPQFPAAVGAVLDANDAKCPNGIATHDANGKIVKPTDWQKPNLQPFVDRHGL